MMAKAFVCPHLLSISPTMPHRNQSPIHSLSPRIQKFLGTGYETLAKLIPLKMLHMLDGTSR